MIARQIDKPPETILDLGTGNGAIALGLARYYPAAQVTAVDLSEEALALARENTGGRRATAEHVTLVRSNWFAELPPALRFDLIVANPPYLSADEAAQTAPEVKVHEPAAALAAADDGLADLRVIIAGAPRFLAPGGWLALETGITQHAELARLATAAGFKRTESLQDLTGRDRFLLAWQRLRWAGTSLRPHGAKQGPRDDVCRQADRGMRAQERARPPRADSALSARADGGQGRVVAGPSVLVVMARGRGRRSRTRRLSRRATSTFA